MSDIVIIGGINIDIEGKPRKRLRYQDSNPGDIRISFGGVGRNIAENLARLSADTAMISFTGDDYLGRDATEQLKQLGVNTDHIRCIEGLSTGMYLSILNEDSDMTMGICNMDILQEMTPEFIKTKEDFLNKAKIVAVDCNLSLEALTYITENIKVPLFLETISASKCEKVRPIIGRFHTIKPNRIEAEILCGRKIVTAEDAAEACRWFADQGVKNIFISLGEEGMYYKSEDSEGIVPTGAVEVKSATGAGDACSAAILWGFSENLTAEETAKAATECAAYTLRSEKAVSTELNSDVIRNILKKETPGTVCNK